MAKYLDDIGLSYFWGRLKAYFTKKGSSTRTAGHVVTWGSDDYTIEDSGYTIAKSVPSDAVFTDTVYTGTSPISVSGTNISHANSGVTAASKGDASNQTPGFGSTFKALSGTVNATGHLTAFAEHTVKIPDAVATTSTKGLMNSTDKAALDNVSTRADELLEGEGTTFDGAVLTYDMLTASDSVIHYGVCSTAAGTATKTVSINADRGGYTLVTGAWVAVKFTVTNTAAVGNLKLQINSTTAASIKYRGANLPSVGTLAANRVYFFIYDGTNWELIGDLDTNTTYTPASANPLMDGAVAVGTSAKYAREDHRHPTDTSRAPLASPTFTGTPAAPTAAAGNSSTQIATTAFVQNAISSSLTGVATFQAAISSNTAISSLTDYKKGWYWLVTVAGEYVGQNCEPGDMIYCITNRGSAYSASNFTVVQTNLDLATITNAEIDTIVAS